MPLQINENSGDVRSPVELRHYIRNICVFLFQVTAKVIFHCINIVHSYCTFLSRFLNSSTLETEKPCLITRVGKIFQWDQTIKCLFMGIAL